MFHPNNSTYIIIRFLFYLFIYIEAGKWVVILRVDYNFQNIFALDTEEKSQQNVKLQNSKPMSSVWVQVAFQSMASNVPSAILHVMNVV